MIHRTFAVMVVLIVGLATSGCAGADSTQLPAGSTPAASASSPAGATPVLQSTEDNVDTESNTDPAPSGGIPYSATDPLPTLARPTAPPKSPTDVISGLWVIGTLISGSDGPCYEFLGDNGPTYAVTGTAMGHRTAGERLRIRLISRDDTGDCGPGEPMLALQVLPAP